MKKKIAGIILASVLTFSAMAGVQASAEDRLWENSMEADGVEDDISQNQTEMKDGDDSTSEDNEENTEMKELIRPKMIQKLRKIHQEQKKRQKFLLKKNRRT